MLLRTIGINARILKRRKAMANYYKPYFKDGSSITLDGKCTNVKIENGVCRFVDYHGTILAITPLDSIKYIIRIRDENSE